MHETTRILPVHRKMIDLFLAGFKQTEIAAILGRHEVGVGLVLRSALVQEEISRRRDGITKAMDAGQVSHLAIARETLEQGATVAAELLIDQVEDATIKPETRQSAAEKILSAAFGRGSDAGSGRGGVTVISIEQLRILNLAREESVGVTRASVLAKAEDESVVESVVEIAA